ncbi:MAG: hypothetical protein GY854_14465 [Deltaproteobacteria bacterium]|nr:hypothetical protein [Deltaproteobacteria bacterium]
MEDEDKKKIEEIIGGMQCSKNFKCAENGFKNLCCARDIGIESYLDCLEKEIFTCQFALDFGEGRLCQCPLRVFLAKKLKK